MFSATPRSPCPAPSSPAPRSPLPFQDPPSKRNPRSCFLRASLRCINDSRVCSPCLGFPQPGACEAPRCHAQLCLSLLLSPRPLGMPQYHDLSTHDGHVEVSSLRLIEIRLLRTHTSPAQGLLSGGRETCHRRLMGTLWALLASSPTSHAAGLPGAPPCSAGHASLHPSGCMWVPAGGSVSVSLVTTCCLSMP